MKWLLFLLILLVVPCVSAVTYLDNCTTINTGGEYEFNQTINWTTDTDCFTITANDVSIDGAGFNLTTNESGNDAFVLQFVDNVTIKNIKSKNFPDVIYCDFSSHVTFINYTRIGGTPQQVFEAYDCTYPNVHNIYAPEASIYLKDGTKHGNFTNLTIDGITLYGEWDTVTDIHFDQFNITDGTISFLLSYQDINFTNGTVEGDGTTTGVNYIGAYFENVEVYNHSRCWWMGGIDGHNISIHDCANECVYSNSDGASVDGMTLYNCGTYPMYFTNFADDNYFRHADINCTTENGCIAFGGTSDNFQLHDSVVYANKTDPWSTTMAYYGFYTIGFTTGTYLNNVTFSNMDRGIYNLNEDWARWYNINTPQNE